MLFILFPWPELTELNLFLYNKVLCFKWELQNHLKLAMALNKSHWKNEKVMDLISWMALHSLAAETSVAGGSAGEGMSITLIFLIQPLFSCKENLGEQLPCVLDLDVRNKMTRISPAESKNFLLMRT